jgi:putative ABC transport system ATP-binding protein
MKDQFGASNLPLIELNGVNKQFPSASGDVPVLKNINLTVERGEFIAIVGKSGSGKSTLLNMITGIDHPSRGSVAINSTDVHRLDESRLAKWRGENIGIVFQFFQLIPTLTIRENLLLAMDFVGSIPKKDRGSRAETLLARVGIASHGGKLPSALSGGEQQRAAIARALANDPPVLVADEPTGNLDSVTTEAIQRLFRDLVKSGKTVIVVTHEDVSHSDYSRIVSLHDGEVVSDRRNNQEAARRAREVLP